MDKNYPPQFQLFVMDEWKLLTLITNGNLKLESYYMIRHELENIRNK